MPVEKGEANLVVVCNYRLGKLESLVVSSFIGRPGLLDCELIYVAQRYTEEAGKKKNVGTIRMFPLFQSPSFRGVITRSTIVQGVCSVK